MNRQIIKQKKKSFYKVLREILLGYVTIEPIYREFIFLELQHIFIIRESVENGASQSTELFCLASLQI